MIDTKKSKKQLIEELEELRAQTNELKSISPETSGAGVAESSQDCSALAAREDFLNEAEQVANIGSWSWDLQTGAVEWSDNLCAIHEVNPDEFDGKLETALSFVHPDDLESLKKNIQLLLDAKKPIGFEYRIIGKDGAEKIVSAGQRIYLDDHGTVVRMAGILRDITASKQAEEALSDCESKYRTLFEESDDPILIIEGDKFVDCNPSAVKILGYKNKDELLDTHPSQLSPEIQSDGRDSFTKANEILRVAYKHGSQRFEWDHMRQNGEIFPVEVLMTPVSFRDKNFIHVVWRDITEHKRLRQLESRAARLETAGIIAGQVAHDFNNLLAPLVAYPGFIREKLPSDHPALVYLDKMEKAAQKIADINQQLLTLGRRGHYNQDALNLNPLIHQAVREMAPLPDNAICTTELDSELMNVLGGASQIYRVITNLLGNAVDAIQGNGRVIIKTENYYVDDMFGAYGRVPKGEYVKLTISDNGCGISDDIVQKILDPFFTTKTTSKRRGSGLGLSIVDAVVKDHDGYLDLETKLGKGTSFYLYFPITRRLVDEGHSDEISGGAETILVVDDDDVQRDVTTQLLEGLGYKVNSVDSGEKAIEFLRKNPHDLVILDMIMPGGMDGTETYQHLLEFSPNQKAIIVSGFSETSRAQAAQELGVGAFVKKPLSKKAIALAVRTELDRKQKVVATV